MDLRRLIRLRDLNIWLALAAVGCGVILMAVVAVGTAALLGRGEAMAGVGQFVLVLGTFLATFLTALISGRIARENGVTYGLVGSAGVVVVVVIAMPLSVVTLLLALTAVAGGFNGGMMIERRNSRRRR